MEEDGPAVPVSWPQEKRGMQGGEELGEYLRDNAENTWVTMARLSSKTAATMNRLGVHKSVVNRILEPYMWHTVVVTATAWENFFEQRCSPLAQPEIKLAAEMMRDAYSNSKPRLLKDGQWHTPFVDEKETEEILDREHGSITDVLQISSARCARTSYLTHDGKRDIHKDFELYDKLVTAKPIHWSPLEHVATPWLANRQDERISFTDTLGQRHILYNRNLPRVGNLLGWRQLRTEIEASQGETTYR
jgi:hypothetical protein